MKRIVYAAVIVLILSGCGSTSAPPAIARPTARQASDRYVALLDHYHWTAQAEPDMLSLTIPQRDAWNTAEGQRFNLYLEASRAIGLDFTPWAGQTVQLRNYVVGHTPIEHYEIAAHLIGDEHGVVGAWLSIEATAPGIYPLTTSVMDLSYLSIEYWPMLTAVILR